MVSHELRTPLTSIRMFTETLVLRRGDRVAEDRCIQALEKETHRLSQLIDRLLDWGRMQSGMRTYTLEKANVAEVVEDAVSAFGPTREKKEVEVEIDVEPDLPPILCDKAALVDALVNLLSNAYKYSTAPREIRISASRIDDKLRIAVKDNGKGIARREHKRIFEKFYRVDDFLTRREDGSGLGLAIVQHIVRGHHGKVEIESDLGRGSEFAIVLSADPSKLELLLQTAQQT
jgi:two-component system phosphate regulon sensor histidine kinase PhoR